jgi:hypothetical protein
VNEDYDWFMLRKESKHEEETQHKRRRKRRIHLKIYILQWVHPSDPFPSPL